VTDKLCLRCDWSGAIGDDTCPRCGAGLFSAGSGKTGADVDRPATALAEHRTERSWRTSVAVVLIVVFAVVAVVIVQRHTPSEASSEAVDTGRTGFLITSAPEGDGARMWIWDLGADTAVSGPLLHRTPEELVYTYEVQAGWIGITSTVGAGVSASVLRRLGPNDRPLPVARGDAVAWVPSSSSVSVLRSRPVGACTRLIVSTWFVSIRTSVERFDGVRCGEPVAFARDRNLPYLTIERDGIPTTMRVGAGYTQPIVPGYQLLSASADGDLLVQRPGGGLALAYLARAGTSPVPIGGHGRTLDPIRVLGWSADASQAFVFGTFDNAQGIFRVTVGPQPRPRPPVLLLATNAIDIQMSATAGGDLYLATDGALSLVHGDLVEPVSAPPGVPAPVGPVLWVATLPYSPAEG
jgi:hypothetical protein